VLFFCLNEANQICVITVKSKATENIRTWGGEGGVFKGKEYTKKSNNAKMQNGKHERKSACKNLDKLGHLVEKQR